MWGGTALSKHGLNDEAVSCIVPVILRFEQLEEPQDWSVAYQTLALARRGAADLGVASAAIEVALNNALVRCQCGGPGSIPLTYLSCSDVVTAASGLALLDAAAATASR